VASKTEKAARSLETTKDIYPILKEYYRQAQQAKEEGKLVCWAGVGDPRELYWVMDIMPIFPENFSATCGAKQVASQACEVAENCGYARETCSYFRNTYGFMTGDESIPPPPAGGMPAPDLLIIAINSCHTRSKWWRIMERHYHVPTFILEAPTIPWNMRKTSIGSHYVDFVVTQLKELVLFLEKHTGKKFSVDKLEESIALSRRTAQLLDEIYALRKAIPCPMGAEDMATAIMPIIVFRGTKLAVEFYEKLAAELKQRVADGEGVLQNEKIRLLVDNIPPWYTRGLYNYFHKYDGISVAETYTTTFGWESPMNFSDPMKNLAYSTMLNWLNISFAERGEILDRLVQEYSINGVIFLANKSCKVYSGSNMVLAKSIREKRGVPSLMLEFDQTDQRDYADSQVKLRIDTFMEMLGR